MAENDEPREWDFFTLRYSPEPSGRYNDIRQGYWVASTTDGNYDADGLTPEAALAALVVVLAKEVRRARQ